MTLSPEDVERQVFKERFRGYDQDEVDRFLDRVSARIGDLIRERDELTDKTRELEREASEVGESQQLLQRTLLAAQRSADETIDEARATAEQTLEDARRQAEEIVAGAHRQVHEDERRAMEVLQHVRRVVDELSRFRHEYRERVEAVIAEQLAMLDRVGDLPELPEGLRTLAQHADSAAESAQHEEAGRVYWEHGSEG